MYDRDLSKLIGDIYEAPLTPLGWSGVVPALEERLRARVAFFMQMPSAVATVAACGPADPAMVRQYEGGLWREDRAMRKLRFSPASEIVLDSQLITDRERNKSPFYHDYLGSLDSHRGIYASVARESGKLFVVSAQRSASVGDYTPSETDLLRRLLPHLHRSFRTSIRLAKAERERSAALMAMEHASVGYVLVDRSSRISFANKSARTRLADASLKLCDGRVTAQPNGAADALRAAIEAATDPARPVPSQLTVPVRGGSPLSVLVSPVGGETLGPEADPLAMLTVGAAHRGTAERASFARAYGLTPAEMRLLQALVAGERLGEYAGRTGISLATAKSHLGALFDKVGERRQADLIRRAISDPLYPNTSFSPVGSGSAM